MKYWLIINNRQTGPLTAEEIAAGGYLRRDTPVWHEGLPNWITAGDVEELAALLTPPASPVDVFDAQHVTASAPSAPAEVPIVPADAPVVATGWMQAKPRRIMAKEPDTYLLWSILTTILCCLPTGIAAIVMSSRVSSRYSRGDYEGAVRASRAAELWIIVTVVLGLVAIPFQMVVTML